MRKASWLGLVGVFLGLLLVVGCGGEPPKAAAPAELNVSAAVSMKDALGEIQQQYQKKNPNVKLVFNLGASGSLQKQIEQGAPADLFISGGAAEAVPFVDVDHCAAVGVYKLAVGLGAD